MFYRLWNHRKPEGDPEPPPVGSRDRQFRGIFAGVPLIIGLVTITTIALLVFLNARFIARLNECRNAYVTYPRMEIVSEQEPYFLQPNGILLTELYSPDDPAVVRDWFGRAYGALMRQAVISGDFRDMPQQTWSVEAAEGGGSTIMLTCP